MTINLINNKKYIGQDSNNNPNYLGGGVYLNKAIKKYGRYNFKKIILEYVDDVNKLREREEYWIDKFNAYLSKEFYNLTEKGVGWIKGKSHGRRKKMESPVDQYDLQGNFIKSWETIKDANEKLDLSVGVITNVCKGKYKSAGGFLWAYKDKKVVIPKIPRPNHNIVITQHDSQGNFIKEWNSIKEASETLKLWNIKKVLYGVNKTCGGYVWRYKHIRTS